MVLVKCPLCDYKNKFQDEMDAFDISTCSKCGFDFKSNKCANPECGKHLHFSKKICNECGNESEFYLNSYDVRVLFFDED